MRPAFAIGTRAGSNPSSVATTVSSASVGLVKANVPSDPDIVDDSTASPWRTSICTPGSGRPVWSTTTPLIVCASAAAADSSSATAVVATLTVF